MDAQGLIEALRAAGLPVKGLKILDPADPSTWAFVGLDDGQTAKAIALVTELLKPPPQPPDPGISLLQFLRLLLPEEYAEFVHGGDTDPMLLYAKALLEAAPTIHATDPDFQQMLAYCVGTGKLTQARADEIVAAMIPGD